MILKYGDISRLEGLQWNVLELRSEKTSEETIKRIGKSLKLIFKDDPVELFVPIADRNLDNFKLMTDCYVFVRSLDPKKIVRLRTVTGVVWLVCHGEGTHPSRLMKIDDDYIQNLIKDCKQAYAERHHGIVPGSFVRIIDGHARDFCGIVKNMDNQGSTIVQVDLKTTSMMVQTPLYNLLNMNSIPKNLRVFYYSSILELDSELIEMLEEDLVGDRMINIRVKTVDDKEFQEAIKPLEHIDKKNKPKVKRTNQQMITAFVKNLIYTGDTDIRVIATKLFAAIKEDRIRRPKNLVIAWCVLKYHVTKTMYGNDPDIKSYKDVITKYGNSYKISIKELAKMAPWLSMTSEEVCTDRRSKNRGIPVRRR
jgi:transcription antitermination factor NusG